MELRQLEYVVAVAEEANFTRAAARVNVTQPGISAQVRQLERELGQPLFDRSGRSVRLTAVGAAVLPYARAALDAARGARLAVDQLTGLVRGSVAIGMVSGCSLPVLARLLAGFHARYPGIRIGLSEDTSERLMEGVRTGGLDLALAGVTGERAGDVASFPVVDEALVAAVPLSHPLAPRRTIGMAALDGVPVISLPGGTGVRSAFDAACARQGVRPNVVFEASALSMVAQLAAEGLGVAILPSSVADASAETLRAIGLSPEVRSRLDLVWSPGRSHSPAAGALIHHVAHALPAA